MMLLMLMMMVVVDVIVIVKVVVGVVYDNFFSTSGVRWWRAQHCGGAQSSRVTFFLSLGLAGSSLIKIHTTTSWRQITRGF